MIFLFVIGITVARDNSLRIKKNLLERILKLIMAINDKIRHAKLQYKILTEKPKRYQHYHQVKLINMNFLQVKQYYHLIKVEK